MTEHCLTYEDRLCNNYEGRGICDHRGNCKIYNIKMRLYFPAVDGMNDSNTPVEGVNSPRSSSLVANTAEVQVGRAVGSNPTLDTFLLEDLE